MRSQNKPCGRKSKKMASSPGQVLHQQGVRHSLKDHSQRKDEREKDNIHAPQHQELPLLL